jgi:glycosyltransferase involved in cell wall biosynthesis
MKGLDRTRFEPCLRVPGEGELADGVRDMGIPVLVRSFGSIKPKRIVEMIQDIRWLRGVFRSRGVEIVHTDHPRDTFYAVLAALFSRAKVVWHVRVTTPSHLDRFNARLVDRIIGVSRATAGRFPGSYRTGGKFRCVYNGVDLRLFERGDREIKSVRKSLTGGEDVHVVTTVGQIVVEKGIHEFVEAAARVIESVPRVKFFSAGTGTPEEVARVESRIEELGIGDRVRLLGHRNDVPDILLASDIVVLASHDNFEGCPRVVLEAMAAGRPVVGTDVKGTRELVTKETGLLVPPNDSVSLARAIERLLSEPETMEKMGVSAQRIARENFDIRRHISSIQEIYLEFPREGKKI